MRLHELTTGQRFTFSDKHRGKVFEVTAKRTTIVEYKDVATGQLRIALSHRKTFRMEVELVTLDKMVSLESIILVVQGAYQDEPTEAGRAALNKLYLKLTGSDGRRVVLPEGE